MDPANLKTASAYLNNLLLARGLLRDGKPISFARPQKGEETMAQIINLVHDMVLRRDVRSDNVITNLLYLTLRTA
jgi:afadin/alpha-actinin-binding protein